MAEELPDPDSSPYWEGINIGELRYQHCDHCSTSIFYPRSICPNCGKPDPIWQTSKGKGTIYACSVIHRAPPAYKEDTPYVVALVDLAEGFRMMSRIIDCDTSSVKVGQRVGVVYSKDSTGNQVPYFTPNNS